MEYFGIIAFVLVLSQMGSSSKITKLEKEIKRLKRKLEGDNSMSKLLMDLIGHKCLIECENVQLECEVVDVDDEWVKIISKEKKGKRDIIKTQIIPVNSIENIELKN